MMRREKKTVTQGERNMNSQRISDRWEMLQEIKQGKRNILLNGIGEVSGALVHNEIDGAVSKHRHPHERNLLVG